jgi:hypothetical protein
MILMRAIFITMALAMEIKLKIKEQVWSFINLKLIAVLFFSQFTESIFEEISNLDFTGFNNTRGSYQQIIPSILHFYHMGEVGGPPADHPFHPALLPYGKGRGPTSRSSLPSCTSTIWER